MEKVPLIFLCAAGIAVRKIAPFLRSKAQDPPVLCMDDGGNFVIPLLSGHLGGANELAQWIARRMAAQPVITTATDICRKFAVDVFAEKNGLLITDFVKAKKISAAALEGIPVVVAAEEVFFREEEAQTSLCAAGKPGETVDGVCCVLPEDMAQKPPQEFLQSGDRECARVLVSPYFHSWEKQFPDCLRLLPGVFSVGIGCRRAVAHRQIAEVIDHVFAVHGLDFRAVFQVSSIDLKGQEEGLVRFCREREVPFCTFSAEELSALEGEFQASDFVWEVTGVDNVCERSALAGAGDGGRLLVTKYAQAGVTVAVAVRKLRIDCDIAGAAEVSGEDSK